MTKTNNRLNFFITQFMLFAFFVLAIFLISNNLQFFFAYGAQEKSLFFGYQFDISSNNGTSELPQIATQGNNVYVVWQDNTSGNYDIMFTYSRTMARNLRRCAI